MKIKKILNSQIGASMIQVMIAGAMMAGVAVVGMKLMNNQQKISSKARSNSDIDEYRFIIMSFLHKKEHCENALVGLTKGDTFTNLKFNGDENFASVEDTIGSTGLKITSLKILTDSEALEANKNSQLINIRMGLEQTKSTIGGKDKFLYFSIVGKLGLIESIERATEEEVRSDCQAFTDGEIVDDKIFKVKQSQITTYLGECEHSMGTMILSCGL